VCDPGKADCDKDGLTCETNLGTDTQNCGACGHDCVGGTCQAAVCQPYLLYSGAAGNLALDGNRLYFVSMPAFDLVSMQTNGLGLQTLVQGNAGGFVITTQWVFYATQTGALKAVPKNGGASLDVWSDAAFQYIGGVTANATDVFWLALDNGGNPSVWKLYRKSIGGGAATVVDTGGAKFYPVVADADRVYGATMTGHIAA
jgi:hypothetical protein